MELEELSLWMKRQEKQSEETQARMAEKDDQLREYIAKEQEMIQRAREGGEATAVLVEHAQIKIRRREAEIS